MSGPVWEPLDRLSTSVDHCRRLTLRALPRLGNDSGSSPGPIFFELRHSGSLYLLCEGNGASNTNLSNAVLLPFDLSFPGVPYITLCSKYISRKPLWPSGDAVSGPILHTRVHNSSHYYFISIFNGQETTPIRLANAYGHQVAPMFIQRRGSSMVEHSAGSGDVFGSIPLQVPCSCQTHATQVAACSWALAGHEGRGTW